MKVVYILHSVLMGGATISFINMVVGLMTRGITPIVFLPHAKNGAELKESLQKNNISFIETDIVSSIINRPQNIKSLPGYVKRALFLPYNKQKSYRSLKQLIQSINPDIIHTNTGVVHEGFHIAHELKIPHVWHLREYQTRDFHWKIYPSFSKFCSYLRKSYVVTITDDIRHYFHLDNYSAAQTIYNGIYHSNEVCYIDKKERYFLLASRVSPEKGHLDVIKAFADFSGKDKYKLKILGFGHEPFMNKIKELADSLGCLDCIEFLGYQSDVRPYMSRAKALVVASPNEGFGRMTAEALFCGTLVIGRNTAGTKEILSNTGGLTFNTIEEMTQMMEYVNVMSDSDYKEQALHAQKVTVASYSIESNIDKVYSLYKQINSKDSESHN